MVPRKHAGTDDASNLALACDRCNLHKGTNLSGIDPGSHSVVRLFDARTQECEAHFAFRGAFIVGLTDTGRATVDVLQMNAPRRLRLRALLLEAGELM